MSNQINSFSQCKKCKKEEAVIFQDNGEFCLDYWDSLTHPNISAPKA